MAGGLHGGRRPGSGRKPKPRHLRALDGGADHKPVLTNVPSTNSTGMAPIEEFDAPDALRPEERLVWLKLAPHAFAARTLTRATAMAFERLCRNIVLEQELALDPDERGKTNHRGILQRIDTECLAFNLAPCGKPMYEPVVEAKPANPLDRFLKRAQ